MDTTINIAYDDIYQKVYNVTGKTGCKSGDIDKISVTEDEVSLSENYIEEASAELADIISSCGTVSSVDSTVTVSLDMPANWKDTVKPSLEKNIESYIVNSICLKWYTISNKEDVKYYSEKIAANTANIIKLLCERKRPER